MDNQFMAGQVAMISRGHWIVQNAVNAKLDMDVAIPPSKVNDYTVIGFGGYAVSKTSQYPEIAKDLIGELTSLETQKEEGEGGGGVPGRKSAAETPAFLAFPPSAALYYQTVPHTLPVPSPANFQEVEKIFIRYYQAMMADEMPIAEGVKKAHEELEASFARLKAQMAQVAGIFALALPRPGRGGRWPSRLRWNGAAREMTAIAMTSDGRRRSDLRREPGARRLSFRPAVLRALHRLRAGAGRRHRHSELQLLRPDARLALGRLRQLRPLLLRRPLAADLLEHAALRLLCGDVQCQRRDSCSRWR